MAGQNPGSPTDFQYFYDDEVFKINNRGQVVFGLVLENYEANSSDQESDVETPIQKGEIRVVWHPTGTERVISEKSVGLADRSLMPGDVVRRLVADSQRGYCRDIHMTASMQIVGTNHVIQNVNSARLQPLEEYTTDLAVCLDSWVGTSDSVHNRLRLVSNDGSCLEYPVDSCPLEDYSTHSRRFMQHAMEYYPGQIVYGPLGLLEEANWINITKEMKTARKHKMHEHKFTVESVITDSVNVHWQCRALSTSTEDPPQQPKFVVEGEDLKRLKLLNVFESCTLQVGDRNYLTIGPEDTFITKKQWKKNLSKYYRGLRKEHRIKKQGVKPEGNTDLHVPSPPHHHRSKKRPTSHRKQKTFNVLHAKIEHADEMKLESLDENMEIVNSTRIECLDDELKTVTCPSIKVEVSGEQCLSMTSQEDCVEEKNDSGISPEPNKEENLMLNGDSKWFDTDNPDNDEDNWENTSSEGSDTDSGATWSSRCSSRGKRSPLVAVRLLRGKRLRRAPRRASPRPPPSPGTRVVVETLHTLSAADVVWQDGSTQNNIPSTTLYPIHHLDGQECFPGDLVVDGTTTLNDTQVKHREYGVVQRVDHHGRTAIVHWYRTYTSAEEPIPQMLYESEMSVYDLKDHPNFQFRPGTVVIRVANFTGEDATCTAGQVIDNFPSGRVKVWWVDGHTSMCWPQDLYKVGEYDSEEGELWASEGSASEDSWETQSSAHDAGDKKTEDNTPTTTEPVISKSTSCESSVPRLLEPRVASHMQRGREALQRLQEMFAKQPALQNQEIMRKLLNLYKDCRFLDKLMGTYFFHEDHFLGLLERVRERGATTPSAGEQRVHEQLTKLFTPTEETDKEPDFSNTVENEKSIVDSSEQVAGNNSVATDNNPGEPMEVDYSTPNTQVEGNACNLQASGSNLPDNANTESFCTEPKESAGSQSSNVCYKLCSLIHTQLVKAHAEISRRRPAELAEFLNGLMKTQPDAKEKLPYHFSVQYGALVVSMAEKEAAAKNEAKHTKDNPNGAENIFAESGFPKAPLATVESDLESERAEGFSVLESAPLGHRFRLSMLQPSDPKSFYSAVKREIKLLKSDLPPGVWVRGYEDRIDLLSVMIAGPSKTPYEGGIFLFDVQLGGEYPRAPPLCHYHSYCTDRLNPNLYEDGKVCVSLLGTWSGRGVEVWGKDSSLLQVIVSLQGLILNSEPYFNEAGYEQQKGTQQGKENSRMYNEMVLLKLVQSMSKMLFNPPEPFKYEILEHLKANSESMCRRLEDWVHLSNGKTDVVPPEFPLVPASRGFCLTLNSSLEAFRNALKKNDIAISPSTL